MEKKNNDNPNLIINNIKENKDNQLKENNNIKNKTSNKKEENDDINIVNGYEDNYNACYYAKRSYSCKVNDSKNKKLINNEEIKMNLNKKFMCLQTPQIKPKKSKLNPNPINIGSISHNKKKSRFNILKVDENNNDIINDVISEDNNENSNDFSCDSSSDFTDEEDVKETNEVSDLDKPNDIENNNNIINNVKNNLLAKKLKSENMKYVNNDDYKIIEENDDYDEYGQISLKSLRKEMFQSKRKFTKNDKDIIDKIENGNIKEQIKKYKDDILLGIDEKEMQMDQKFHKTTGFPQARKNNLPILDFLKKNSSKNLIASK